MKLLVTNQNGGTILECPEEIVKHVDDYLNEFYLWISDKSHDHHCWFKNPYEPEKEKEIVSYGPQDFADWLNIKYIREFKDAVRKIDEMERPIPEEYLKLPTLYL